MGATTTLMTTVLDSAQLDSSVLGAAENPLQCGDRNDTLAATNGGGSDRSLRLYSKKHRVYVLREFLLKTYGDYLSPGDVVLDVAGGKGDLSWLLHNIDDYRAVVVDPRRTNDHVDKSVAYLRAHPDECRKRAVAGLATYQPIAALMPKLEAKNFRMQTPSHLRVFADGEFVDAVRMAVSEEPGCGENWSAYWSRASSRTLGYSTPTGKNDFSIDQVGEAPNSVTDSGQALDVILRARLIVGFHPDQATDYCFRIAAVLQIPVCVVPCCVFPSEFPHRRLYDVDSEEEVPVECYDELMRYLLQENQGAHTASLSFPGTTTARRIAIYTLPPSALRA